MNEYCKSFITIIIRCSRRLLTVSQMKSSSSLGSGVVALGTVADDKVALIVGVTKDLNPKVHAGKIVQELAKLVGGSGGGRPDLAEAGGKDTSGLQNAIDQVSLILERTL